MLFKVVLRSAHLKVDLGGFIFNLPEGEEQGGVCTDFPRPAMGRSKLVERGIAHTPGIQE